MPAGFRDILFGGLAAEVIVPPEAGILDILSIHTGYLAIPNPIVYSDPIPGSNNRDTGSRLTASPLKSYTIRRRTL